MKDFIGATIVAVVLAIGAFTVLALDYRGVFKRWEKIEQDDEPPMGEV